MALNLSPFLIEEVQYKHSCTCDISNILGVYCDEHEKF